MGKVYQETGLTFIETSFSKLGLLWILGIIAEVESEALSLDQSCQKIPL
jgi:hypothetical protein